MRRRCAREDAALGRAVRRDGLSGGELGVGGGVGLAARAGEERLEDVAHGLGALAGVGGVGVLRCKRGQGGVSCAQGVRPRGRGEADQARASAEVGEGEGEEGDEGEGGTHRSLLPSHRRSLSADVW